MAKKTKRKLDRTLPFGTVFGATEAAYEQFGILFDGNDDELPGFEAVIIPKQEAVASEAGNEHAAQLAKMAARIEELEAALADQPQPEDTEAALEELQGQLDTANIEIARLNALLEELSGVAADPEAPAPPDKSKKKASAAIDDQLALQTGGAA